MSPLTTRQDHDDAQDLMIAARVIRRRAKAKVGKVPMRIEVIGRVLERYAAAIYPPAETWQVKNE